MASPSLTAHLLTPSSNKSTILYYTTTTINSSFPSFTHPTIKLQPHHGLIKTSVNSYRITTRGGFDYENEDEDEETCSFDEAVSLFNRMEYYKCHDVLEALWHLSEEPTRTLIHGLLQCAVGLHHLFNQNHKGAMMELGEGVCKLRKMNFENGPFHRFEREISAVLEFIYQTQLEQAACTDDICIAMDQSERSYQLLGGYAAGERLYYLEIDRSWNAHIVYRPEKYRGTATQPPGIKIPVLEASEEHILQKEYL